MFSLRRQWHRFQLARELLEQYEYEDAHQLSFPELMRRMEAFAQSDRNVAPGAAARWAEAVRAKAEQYPSDG